MTFELAELAKVSLCDVFDKYCGDAGTIVEVERREAGPAPWYVRFHNSRTGQVRSLFGPDLTPGQDLLSLAAQQARADAKDRFNDFLDEIYEPYKIMDITFLPHEVLAQCDPVAYTEMMLCWRNDQATAESYPDGPDNIGCH